MRDYSEFVQFVVEKNGAQQASASGERHTATLPAIQRGSMYPA